MATKHINIRVEEELADSIDALRTEDESRATIYNKLLKAGLEAITAAPKDEEDSATDEAPPANTSELETLRDYVGLLKDQLAIKDEQIQSLTKLTQNAQQLHAASEAQSLLAPAPTDTTDKQEHRSIWARIFGKD
jgi:hypothetical protein